MERSPYEVLKLPKDADGKSIRQAYKDLIRTFTPEQQPEKFSEIREAFEYFTKKEQFISPALFPLYQNFLSELEELTGETGVSREEASRLLATVFETPYNTAYELKAFMEQSCIDK